MARREREPARRLQTRVPVKPRPSPALIALGFVDRRIVGAALRSARGNITDAASLLGVSPLELMILLADEPELMKAAQSSTGISGMRPRTGQAGADAERDDDGEDTT